MVVVEFLQLDAFVQCVFDQLVGTGADRVETEPFVCPWVVVGAVVLPCLRADDIGSERRRHGREEKRLRPVEVEPDRDIVDDHDLLVGIVDKSCNHDVGTELQLAETCERLLYGGGVANGAVVELHLLGEREGIAGEVGVDFPGLCQQGLIFEGAVALVPDQHFVGAEADHRTQRGVGRMRIDVVCAALEQNGQRARIDCLCIELRCGRAAP